ncbi:AMP-binding protein, partial [Nocardia nova]|uniref:AMP-binding protein n=1 Tax=Nocardia nova TaxID=37330 RepID=UPI0025AF607F
MSRNDASPYDAETATPSRWAPIEKSAAEIAAATLPDYGRARRDFSWSAARSELAGLPGGAVNIAVEAVDRHLEAPIGPAPSLRWLPVTGGVTELDCADLVRLSNKFAHVLRDLGVYRGERVCLLLGRTPELYLVCLGAWKAGCVVSPLFSAFGPEPVRQRLDLAEASTLVTTAAHYRRKVAPIRDTLPALRHVIVVDGETDLPGVVSLPAAMAAADSEFPIVRTQFEDPALLHFTSGTTGRPKGAVHVHGAVVAHRATARAALDLRGGDVFWCT